MNQPPSNRATRGRSLQALAFWAFTVVAVISAFALSDWGGGVPEGSVWLARGAFAIGGAAVGLLSGGAASNREVVLACLAPLTLLIPVGLAMAGLSNSADDLPQIPVILGVALTLFDLPMLVGVALARQRAATA